MLLDAYTGDLSSLLTRSSVQRAQPFADIFNTEFIQYDDNNRHRNIECKSMT